MKQELQKDLSRLFNSISSSGEDSGLMEMQWELVSITYKEFICSETFAKYDERRKKETFDLYERLMQLLRDLESFNKKYPKGIKEAELSPIVLN